MTQGDHLVLAIVGGVVVLAYLPYLGYMFRKYRHERSLRAQRGLFVAAVLVIGLAASFVGRLSRTFPNEPLLTITIILGALTGVLLLSGAVYLNVSVWLEHRRKPRA